MKEIDSKELQYVSGGGILPWPLPDPSVLPRSNPSAPPRRYNNPHLWLPFFL